MQIEYVIPLGVTGRRSGSANVVLPSPPYLSPSSANSATFCAIGSSWPLAAVPAADLDPAVSLTSPSVHGICVAAAVPVSAPKREMYVSAAGEPLYQSSATS